MPSNNKNAESHVNSDHVAAHVDVGVENGGIAGAGPTGGVPGSAGGVGSGDDGTNDVGEDEDAELELGNLSGNNSEDEYYQKLVARRNSVFSFLYLAKNKNKQT